MNNKTTKKTTKKVTKKTTKKVNKKTTKNVNKTTNTNRIELLTELYKYNDVEYKKITNREKNDWFYNPEPDKDDDIPNTGNILWHYSARSSSYTWYINGKKHRYNDLPSEICYTIPICYKWHKNDKLHRINFPAIISGWGCNEYYYEGRKYCKDAFYKLMVNLGYMTETHYNDLCSINISPTKDTKLYKPIIIYNINDIPKRGKFHVTIYNDQYCCNKGDQHWYKNGLLHRDNDLPAVIKNNGVKEWYQNGKKHRDNDEPAIIYPYGTQEWYQHGKRHRDNNLPSIIHDNGNKKWYQNGVLHNINNPAIIDYDCPVEYWYEGVNYNKKEFYDLMLQKNHISEHEYNYIIKTENNVEPILSNENDTIKDLIITENKYITENNVEPILSNENDTIKDLIITENKYITEHTGKKTNFLKTLMSYLKWE